MKQVIVIGGGLAGLINAILLSRKGIEVTIYEKKQYPFHKVCGEYISNETLPFLKREALLPVSLELPQIRNFQFTSLSGRSFEIPLDLGGFGISRYFLDNFLKDKAIESGVRVVEKLTVSNLKFEGRTFHVETSDNQTHKADLVLGTYGKRSKLDTQLQRSFFKQQSPHIGVKYHIKADFPKDKIALHNFKKGYCGISAIENDTYNLCYLGSRDLLRQCGNLEAYQESIVKQNPFLKDLFENSDFLFEKPEVINAFSFKSKHPVERHVLMSGDSAGLIAPLCGNGMAMAIHSAKMLSEIILKHQVAHSFNHDAIEKEYSKQWHSTFRKRLWVGRKTQLLFGSKFTSELAAVMMKRVPLVARGIVQNTHGHPF